MAPLADLVFLAAQPLYTSRPPPTFCWELATAKDFSRERRLMELALEKQAPSQQKKKKRELQLNHLQPGKGNNLFLESFVTQSPKFLRVKKQKGRPSPPKQSLDFSQETSCIYKTKAKCALTWDHTLKKRNSWFRGRIFFWGGH